MKAKQHLHHLRDIWQAAHPSVVATTANALEDIINSIFGDPVRIGYELMQNADDAAIRNGLHIDLKFYLLEEHLVVSHNGAHFSPQNVEALCRYGPTATGTSADIQEKQYDIKKIGYKGIGFKSVFNISDKVWVVSGDYLFRFDKNFWKGDPMPWQIVPVVSTLDELSPQVALLLDPKEVNFVLEIKESADREQVKNKLKSLFESENILLFLRHIRSVELFTMRRGGKIASHRRLVRTAKDSVCDLERYDNDVMKEQTKWQVAHFTLPVPEKLRRSLSHLDKRQCPEKLKNAEEVEIGFAAKLREDETVIPLIRPLIFSYLPTEKRYEFPFLVNGNFLMNEARTQLLNERWNEFLFEQIGYFQFLWFRDMASDDRFRKEFAGLLVKYAENNPERRNRSLNAGVKRAQEEIAFVPVLKSEELKKAPDTIVDRTGVSEGMGEEQWVKDCFEGNDYEIADPGIKKIDRLLSVGAAHFDPQKLRDAIRQGRRFATVDDNGRLIQFFYQKIQSVEDYSEQQEWMQVLHQTPFLLDQKGALKEPGSLYLPVRIPDLPFSISLDFLHSDVFGRFVNTEPGLKDWLNKLGVAYPKPVELIRRGVFPLIANDKIGAENTVPIVRYVFEHRDGLKTEDYQQLSIMPLLTTRNSMREARRCYLADVYEPKLPLEHLLDEAVFVSAAYLQDGADDFTITWWNAFFAKLGVRQEMELLLEQRFISQHELKNDFADYFAFLEPYLPPYNKRNSYSVHTLLVPTYIEYTASSYKFARAYWQILIRDKWKELDEKSGKARFVQANLKHAVPSWFQYLVQNRSYFPATDGSCYPTSELYSASLASLAEGHFPVSDFLLSPDQEELLGIRSSLSLEDCLTLLRNIAGHPEDLDKEKVTSLYRYMASRRFQPVDIAGSALFDPSFPLLAMNNSFQPVSGLVHFNLPRFAEKFDAGGFLFLDLTDGEAKKFCALFDIPSVGLEDLQLVYKPAESAEAIPLQEVWDAKLPMVAVVLAARKGRAYEEERERLEEISKETFFVPVEQMKLVFENEGKEVYRKEVNAWQEGATIYYKQPWNHARTLFDLQEILSRHFKTSGIERELDLLLSIDDVQAREWLSEQGFQWEGLLPEGKKVKRKPSPKSSSDVVQVSPGEIIPPIEVIVPGGKTTVTPSIPAPPFANRLGRWGEEHVRKTGLIEQYYRDRDMEVSVLEWMNADAESRAPFDFRVRLSDNRIHFWEVKATPSATKAHFPVTASEFRHALQHTEDYFIIRILSAGSKEAFCKILHNPVQLIAEGKIAIEGMTMGVRE